MNWKRHIFSVILPWDGQLYILRAHAHKLSIQDGGVNKHDGWYRLGCDFVKESDSEYENSDSGDDGLPTDEGMLFPIVKLAIILKTNCPNSSWLVSPRKFLRYIFDHSFDKKYNTVFNTNYITHTEYFY
jgi:hypothetical protein